MIMAALISALHAFPSTGVLNMKKVEVAYILGAGFSTYAGLSLQSEFTAALLKGRDYNTGPSQAPVDFLSIFIRDAFDHSNTAGARFWPELEDIFTCTDLSAKTGHHLGEPYALSNLRTIWQAPLSRVSRMLQREHDVASKCIGASWSRLSRFFNLEAEFHPFTLSSWTSTANSSSEFPVRSESTVGGNDHV
jgi:hypothetical protein